MEEVRDNDAKEKVSNKIGLDDTLPENINALLTNAYNLILSADVESFIAIIMQTEKIDGLLLRSSWRISILWLKWNFDILPMQISLLINGKKG